MAQPIQEAGKMAEKMDSENNNGQMVQNLKDSGKKIKLMAEEG